MLDRQTSLAERIAAQARQLGFDLAGILPAPRADTVARYRAWLDHGFHGEMAYLTRPDAIARREDLARLQPGVRTALVVAVNYHTLPPLAQPRDDPARGIVARYAWSDDYHDVLVPRLRQLAVWLEAEIGEHVAYHAYVDTGPILERELAARAGMGFIGKNTHLIHPRLGSWLFLGELLLAVDLPVMRPVLTTTGTCGRCTRCLDTCPTGALVAPYLLDARRCISYLTIELRGPIPRELRPLLGNHIFGCDVCQDICPWNRRFARPTTDPAFQPRPEANAPRLLDLLTLDEAAFRQRFRGSPVLRAKRRGLLRNATVALGNVGDPATIPALAHALRDAEPLVRGHAAWALGRLATAEAYHALKQALSVEADDWVRQELRLELADQPPASST